MKLHLHETTINGHRMQVGASNEGYCAFVCMTCCGTLAGVVLFGDCEWDDTPPTVQAAEYAVAHSLETVYAR